DLLLWYYGGDFKDLSPPDAISGGMNLHVANVFYPTFRLVALALAVVVGVGLWLLLRSTRLGMIIRAGIDDRAMVSALGINVQRTFAIVFALGGFLAGLGGVMGASINSVGPGDDGVYLLSSLIFVLQIGFQSLFLGIVALSLIFLASYGGMVSLAQTALYGVAGYTVAIVTVTYGAPWYVGVIAALVMSTLAAFIFGLVSVRTQGIYFLMITLAIAMLLYFYAEQDRIFTNGHTGINGVQPPGGA